MNRKDEILTIKEKSDFLFANSGIISYKLDDPRSYEETLNNLQILLLCDFSMEQLTEVCFFLTSKKNINNFYENDYTNAIKIIFEICDFINKSDYSEDGKASLRNKLREYTKYFTYSKRDMIINHKYIKLKN